MLLNQFSLLLLLAAAAGAAIAWLLRGPGSRIKQVAAVLFLGGLTVAYFLLQPGRAEHTAAAAEALLANGDRPVLVEIYSDY